MAKKSKPKVESPPPKFDVEEITKRLRFIDIEELVQGIFDAIDEAKGMAGSLDPETCDETREALEQLRKTIVFIFGASR